MSLERREGAAGSNLRSIGPEEGGGWWQRLGLTKWIQLGGDISLLPDPRENEHVLDMLERP